MTVDESHDKKIIPQGLHSDKVEPLLDIFPVAKTQPTFRGDVLETQNSDCLKNWLWKCQRMKEKNMKVIMMNVLKLPLIVEENFVHFMKTVALKMTLNTVTKIFVNTMFQATKALRAILAKMV